MKAKKSTFSSCSIIFALYMQERIILVLLLINEKIRLITLDPDKDCIRLIKIRIGLKENSYWRSSACVFVFFLVINVNMSQKNHQLFESLRLTRSKHCQYFANLENRLLIESANLTNFIDPPISDPKLVKTHKVGAWLATPKHVSDPSKSARSVFKKQTCPHLSTPSSNETITLEKALQLCKQFKDYQKQVKKYRSASEEVPKQNYEQHRATVYNLLNRKNSSKQYSASAKEQVKDAKKSFKLLSQHHSTKDTISTKSCHSLKALTEHNFPFSNPNQMKLQDFDIVKPLGEGKIGHVCLVRHKQTNFLCALKTISHCLLSSDPKTMTQRIREIKIQSFMDHPNIVQLYSVFVENGDLHLLMELCYDDDLYRHLKIQGRFQQDKIRSIIKQVCHAVQFLHENDIMHRDLKPQNIMFHENIVKICDFGWAVYSPLLRNTFCGTPLYSSPELALKEHYDNKVDIWNIGVLTYELLYGRVPFEIRSEDDLLKVVEEDVYIPRQQPASPEIKDFIQMCLRKNPRERATIQKLLDHEFLAKICKAQTQ